MAGDGIYVTFSAPDPDDRASAFHLAMEERAMEMRRQSAMALEEEAVIWLRMGYELGELFIMQTQVTWLAPTNMHICPKSILPPECRQ